MNIKLKILMLMVILTLPFVYSDYLEEGSILDPPSTLISYLLIQDINCTSVIVNYDNLTIQGCDESGVYSHNITTIYTEPTETYQNDSIHCYVNIGSLTEDLTLKWIDSSLNVISESSLDCNNDELCLASTLTDIDKNENYSCMITFEGDFYTGYAMPEDFSEIINFVPVITNLYPISEDFNVSEGDEIDFDVDYTDIDDEDSFSFSWLLNGIQKATTKLWQWVVGHTISNPDNPYTSNNVTIIIDDNDGGVVNYVWDIGVFDVNIAPIINDFTQTPSILNFSNNNIKLECNATDEYLNQSELNVTLYYKKPDDITYTQVNNTLINGLFTANITVEPLSENIGLWSFRCKADDMLDDLYSQQTDIDSVEVEHVPIEPNNITSIKPLKGSYDSFLPLRCSPVTDPNTDSVYYDFSVEYNLKNGTRIVKNIYNHTKHKYQFYTGNIIEQENLTIGCRANDGELYNDWYYENTTIKIQRNYKVLLLPMTLKSTNRIFQDIPFNVVCDLTNINNTVIEYAYANCNGDGQWDYLFNYEDKQRIKTVNTFSCYYENAGTKEVTAGCVYTRVNESIEWDENICIGDSDMCKSQRTYIQEVVE